MIELTNYKRAAIKRLLDKREELIQAKQEVPYELDWRVIAERFDLTVRQLNQLTAELYGEKAK